MTIYSPLSQVPQDNFHILFPGKFQVLPDQFKERIYEEYSKGTFHTYQLLAPVDIPMARQHSLFYIKLPEEVSIDNY